MQVVHNKKLVYPEPTLTDSIKSSDLECGDLSISQNELNKIPLPLIDVGPDEKTSWFCKIGFLSMITILLIIALAVRYYVKDTNDNHPQQHHKHKIDQIPTILLSNDMNTNIDNKSIININNTPKYLTNILQKLHKLSSKYIHINTDLSSEFLYGFGDGYNRSEENDMNCFNQTIHELTAQYQNNQLFLISLLTPRDKKGAKYSDNDKNKVPLEIIGGYGGGFQIYCNGNILLSVGGGASFVDKKYPSFLDVQDLIDMNIISIHNQQSFDEFEFEGGGGVQLFMKNVEYVKDKYKYEIMDNNISIGGYWNNTMEINKMYEKLKNSNDAKFDKYLKIILEEMNMCYTENFPINDMLIGLYLFGGGGGHAINTCDYDDILGDAFFYDYYISNW